MARKKARRVYRIDIARARRNVPACSLPLLNAALSASLALHRASLTPEGVNLLAARAACVMTLAEACGYLLPSTRHACADVRTPINAYVLGDAAATRLPVLADDALRPIRRCLVAERRYRGGECIA